MEESFKFVGGSAREPRIVVPASKTPRLDPETVRRAFDAKSMGRATALDFCRAWSIAALRSGA